MKKDIFDQTVKTYCDEVGAAAFVAKELRNKGGDRDVTSYSLLKLFDNSTSHGCKCVESALPLLMYSSVHCGAVLAPPHFRSWLANYSNSFRGYCVRGSAVS